MDIIRSAHSVAIITHMSADGMLGSSSYFGLEQTGKKVTVFLRNLFHAEFLRQHTIGENTEEVFELAICIDTSDMQRLGKRASIYTNAARKITIDHHTTNNMKADGLWIDQKAAAAGEMVYYLIKELKVPINREIAICLYTAIVTDTGGFRYSNTGPQTHTIASELLALEIPFADIAKKVFDIVSHSKMSLMKKDAAKFNAIPQREDSSFMDQT